MSNEGGEPLVPFKRDRLWGFGRPDGTVVVEPVFEHVGEFSSGLCPVRRDKRWKAVDEAGNLRIPHAWRLKPVFRGALAEVQDEHGFHLIDRRGRVLADLTASLTDRGGPCRCVLLKERRALIDFNLGTFVEKNYVDCQPYSDGLCAVAIVTDGSKPC